MITDEAHHVRNSGDWRPSLIERLCLTAEAVLMLSATPVQIHRENLFTLLQLLRPELFQDKQVSRSGRAQPFPDHRGESAATSAQAGREDWMTAAATAVQRGR